MNGTVSLLALVLKHLAARYQRELGQELRTGAEPTVGKPSWRLVKADDLRSPAGSEAHVPAGALLDAELGLVLFIVPFSSGDDLQAQVRGASNLQSTLMPLDPPAAPADEYGSWQVALHWLVQESDREKWENEIVGLRQEGGGSEELIFDAIFYLPGKLEEALAAHGFPRLLLTARRVLAKATTEEITDWMSADRAVLQELEGFPDLFADPEKHRRAQRIVDQLADLALASQDTRSAPSAPPRALDSLEICNFRNLQHVRLNFGVPPVSCRVIHGPNGTGKTSLFEALCLALSGSSARYRAFLDRGEREVPPSGRARAYLEGYLSPLGKEGTRPAIGLNGEQPAPLILASSCEECTGLDHEYSGTLLAQETSREFLRLSSDQLAVRVLAGYSEFAERLEAFVEEEVRKANEGRQSFLRSIGLSASISLFDTAQERIAEQILDRELPQLSAPINDWLSRLERHPALKETVGALLARWREWGESDARATLAGRLAGGTDADAAHLLETCLTESNRLSRQTRELARSFEERLAPVDDHFEEFLRDLASWGEWLERSAGKAPRTGPAPAESEALQRQMAELQKEQQRVMKEGQSTKQHLDHLDQVAAGIARGLVSQEPNRCPTCNADHSARGGIEKVVAELRATITAAREKLLQEYRALDGKIKALVQGMKSQGQTPCPLAEERQAAIRGWLAWLMPSTNTNLEHLLSDPAQRIGLVEVLKTLHTRPAVPEDLDAPDASARILRALRTQIDEARSRFSEPDHWKPVQAEFVKRLARVMGSVLPDTLQRLWVELTLSLTSAPWVMPGRPGFDLATKRGEQRVNVRIQDRLARYILNEAETHVLGLAWFITKYLTHGRFRCRFLIMDDPAQEMDQTSYRDLCRLWRVLLRLHMVRGIPLRLVLFLQQEDRALEAARITRGLVDVLAWVPEQQAALRELEVLAPSAAPATPRSWFEQAKPAA